MRKSFLALALVVCAALPAHAVPVGNITTVAGGNLVGDGVPAAQALYGVLSGIAVDGSGNTYLADGLGSYRIRKITTDGIVHTIGGSGVAGFTGDGGPALQANINPFGGLAVDAQGNVFFVQANRVRRIDAASGIITTVAGNDNAGFSGDGGPATAATLNGPRGIAFANDGSLLIADSQNYRVRRISGGTITTVAGNGQVNPAGSNADAGEGGPATSMALTMPAGIVADGAGGFFVSIYLDNRVRHVDAAGIITTVAGKASSNTPPLGPRPGDGGPAIDASLFGPQALARDAAGNLYVGDYYSLRKIDTGGIINTIAGTGGFDTTAPAYAFPAYVATDASGNVLFTETSGGAGGGAGGRLRKVDSAGHLTTIAGTQAYTGDGGPALMAGLNIFGRAAVMPSGDIYVANGQVVRRIDTSGNINVAMPGFAVATSPAGTLTIVDTGRHRVQSIDGSGAATTIAGTGGSSNAPLNGDGGLATSANLSGVGFITFDAAGNLYLDEPADIRKVDTKGVISTVAGTGGAGSDGEGVAATTVSFNTPGGTAIDRFGNFYFVDQNYPRVRKVDTHGIITTVAGNGTQGFSGDGGPATAAQLKGPEDIAIDDVGKLYIADTSNNRIRVVATDGTISTLAGTGAAAYGDDNVPAASSALFEPGALTWAANGYLYVTETASFGPRGSRLRVIRTGDSTPDAFTFTELQNVPESSVQQSATASPVGYDNPSPISVTGGEYSIGCTATFTAAPGTISPGNTVCVRHTSSSLGNDSVTTSLTIGATVATFRSTTAPDPGSVSVAPAALDFGTIWTNYATPSQDVTVTNTGATTVTVLGVTGTADYALDSGCAALAPAAQCTIHVFFAPLLAGARNATLTVRHTAGNATVTLTGTGERSLTRHYYETILGREPDSAGFTFWEGEAARFTALGANVNETWFAMAMSFYGSAEYAALNRDDRGYVTDLYRTFFNREPDSAGLDYWSGLLGQGLPRGVALASFMFSPEFMNFAQVIFGNTQVRPEMDLVTDFYRGLLGRLPDDAGFTSWLGVMRKAQCNTASAVTNAAASLGSQFITSDEYAARNRTNEQFVGDLYNAYLRRGGDLPGVQFWLQQLASGMPRTTVASSFVGSVEFQNRALKIYMAGCIPAQ